MELVPILLGGIALVALVVVIIAIVIVPRRRRVGTQDPLGESASRATGLGSALRRVFSSLDESTWTHLEDAMLAADVGSAPTRRIVNQVRSSDPKTVEEARDRLARAILSEFRDGDRGLNLWGEPSVIMVVGVNGAGKTTTVAKLAHHLSRQGKSVLLAAADTYRAAGSDQLEVWAERIGVSVVTGQEGGDAAAVVYDALESARAKAADVVIVDTAGRLHGNKNLMEELKKVHRVAGGEEGVGEVLLVLDATAGQNGLIQVKTFGEAVPVTGVALAKFDGSAKGGIVVAVESSLGVPIKLVGTGETISSLETFDPSTFVTKLLSQ